MKMEWLWQTRLSTNPIWRSSMGASDLQASVSLLTTLDHWDVIIRIPQAGWLTQHSIFYPLESRKSKIKAPVEQGSSEDLLPRSQIVVFSLSPHVVKGARSLSGVPFIKSLISHIRALPSRPNHSPKVLPSNIMWGSRISAHALRDDTDIQTIARFQQECFLSLY